MPVANYKQLLDIYDAHTPEIQKYFEHLPRLLKDSYPYEIVVAYLFSGTERAHRRTLYCGIVKRFSANSGLTDEITRSLYLTREDFLSIFKAVFGTSIDDTLLALLRSAEKVRDKGIHGKDPTDAEMREAIKEILDYAHGFNEQVNRLMEFRPFGDLRGFKGRAENMDIDTTKLVLKGLGLRVQ